MFNFLLAKPILVGIHLGFAILAIDAFLWLLGEVVADAGFKRRRLFASVIGLLGFAGTWIFGGYYYVKIYGTVVKPIIKAGGLPWAHAVAMEAKEHIFLFIIPLAVTALILAFMNEEEFVGHNLRRITMVLVGLIAFLGLAIGAMGYIISAAARWG